jgi:hypothetical protein
MASSGLDAGHRRLGGVGHERKREEGEDEGASHWDLSGGAGFTQEEEGFWA